MSDFKRKIEIVESTTPPSNKFNWWFNLNDNVLKRWKGSEWEMYDYTWPTTPYNVANNEILFTISSLEAESISLSKIKTEFNSWGKVKEIRKEYDSRYALELYYIVFEEDLTTIDVANEIQEFGYTLDPINIYFPSSLTDMKSGNSLFLAPGEGNLILHFPNLKYFSGRLSSAEYAYLYIYIYSKTVPQIDWDFINAENPAANIYIPSILFNKYKKNTNWTQYKIESID